MNLLPTFLLQGLKCHLPLRVVVQVTIVQDLVVQCQAAVPETFWNTREAKQVSKDSSGKGLGTHRQRMLCSLPAPCRARPGRLPPRAVALGSKDRAVPQAPVTLPSAIPNLPEAAALTEPVQTLLLDQLKDLGLDLLPQLPEVATYRGRGRSQRALEGRQSGAGFSHLAPYGMVLTQLAGTGSHPGSSFRTGAASESQSSSGCAVCS